MSIEFDADKNERNIIKHGIPLTDAKLLEWDTLYARHNDRRDYGEQRFIGYGLIQDRLHAVVFTLRGSRIRIISLRKANRRERKHYEAQQHA